MSETTITVIDVVGLACVGILVFQMIIKIDQIMEERKRDR